MLDKKKYLQKIVADGYLNKCVLKYNLIDNLYLKYLDYFWYYWQIDQWFTMLTDKSNSE